MPDSLLQGGGYKDIVTPEDTYLIPEKKRGSFHRYRENNLFALVAFFASLRPTGQTKYSHFEKGPLLEGVKLATTVAVGGGAGNATTFEIDSPYDAATGNYSPIAVRETVILNDGTNRFRAYVTAKDTTTANAHTITVVPQDPTVNLATVTLTGDGTWVIRVSNAKSDGSDFRGSDYRLAEEIINYTQIFSKRGEYGKSAMADHTYIADDDGNPYLFLSFAEDEICLHYHQIAQAMLFGRRETNQALLDPDTASGSRTVETTKGLEQHIEDYGLVETYATFALADLEAAIRHLKKQGAGRRHLLIPGYELSIQFNNFLATQNQAYNGQSDFKMMKGDAHFEQARAFFELQFGGITYGNTEIVFSEADFMGYVGNTGFTNATGTRTEPYPFTGFMIPHGGQNVHVEQAANNTEYRDHLEIRYKDNGRITRGIMNEMGKPSWANDKESANLENFRRLTEYIVRTTENTGRSNVELLMETECGIEVTAPHYMVKFEQ